MKKIIVVLLAMIFITGCATLPNPIEVNKKKQAQEWHDKAEVLLKLGEFDKSIEGSKRSLEYVNDNGDVYYIMACAYSGKSDRKNALGNLVQAELSSQYYHGYFCELAIKEPAFQWLSMDVMFKYTCQSFFDLGEANGLLGLGSTELNCDNYDKALEYAEKALLIAPACFVSWGLKGSALVGLGKDEEAIKAYSKYLVHFPSQSSVLYDRACAYSRKQDKINALNDLAKAIEFSDSCYNVKEFVKTEKSFQWLWEDEDFKKIIN